MESLSRKFQERPVLARKYLSNVDSLVCKSWIASSVDWPSLSSPVVDESRKKPLFDDFRGLNLAFSIGPLASFLSHKSSSFQMVR